MADYREHQDQILAAGASLVAISVDPPEKSESVRTELRLSFPILCDTERRLVQDWDIYNEKERGGIARPAVFIIARDRSVLYQSLDSVSMRVPATEIIRILRTPGTYPPHRKFHSPYPMDFIRAIRNSPRRGIPSRKS